MRRPLLLLISVVGLATGAIGCSASTTSTAPATSAAPGSTAPTTKPPSSPSTVYANDPATPAQATVGQVVAIRVETNPSTDYVWDVVSYDQSRLINQGAKYDDTGAGVPGRSVTQNLLFVATAPGTATVVIAYTRAGAPDPSDTTRTFTITITA